MEQDPQDRGRRDLIAAGGAGLASAGLARGTAATASATGATAGPLPPPGLQLAFTARVAIGVPIELGPVDGVRKRVIPITGGSFAGPRVSGTILPGGADWQSIRADGSAEIYARYTLQAADGTIIGIENPGIRRGPAAVLARLAAGDDVDPAAYYFRCTPRFSVGEGPHRWLADDVFVANAARYRDRVELAVYAVL